MVGRRAAWLATGAIAVVAVAGCSGGSHKSTGNGAATGSSNVAATRWWSNSAVTSGSTIDPSHPKAVAGKLHPSDRDYCGMLSDTLKAGKSILPGVTATDPALLRATTAFVAEIQQAAPAEVTGAWAVLGPVIVELARSAATPSALPSIDAGAVQRAATQVAADARTRCGLDLSKVTAGPSGN